MDVVALRDEHAADLYAIYREATARAAHCRFVPSRQRFASALREPSWSATRILVAEESGSARGFAALLPLEPAHDGAKRATISALFVADEAAGQVLIDACARDAQQMGVKQLEAFSANHFRCPVPGYNVGWDALSDTVALVARLLTRNGFKPTYRELLLACDLERFPARTSGSPAGVTVERRVPEDGGWQLRPALDGQNVGSCTYGTLESVVDDPAARRVGYIWGIGIAETARRRGIARYLMNLALSHLQDIGCNECWLGTGAANWPAQPLYLSLGFEIVDATASFRRELY